MYINGETNTEYAFDSIEGHSNFIWRKACIKCAGIVDMNQLHHRLQSPGKGRQREHHAAEVRPYVTRRLRWNSEDQTNPPKETTENEKVGDDVLTDIVSIGCHIERREVNITSRKIIRAESDARFAHRAEEDAQTRSLDSRTTE